MRYKSDVSTDKTMVARVRSFLVANFDYSLALLVDATPSPVTILHKPSLISATYFTLNFSHGIVRIV